MKRVVPVMAVCVALVALLAACQPSNEVSNRDDCQGYVAAAKTAADDAQTAFSGGNFDEGMDLLDEARSSLSGAGDACSEPSYYPANAKAPGAHVPGAF